MSPIRKDIGPTSPYRRLLFARGYVFSDRAIVFCPDGWERRTVLGFNVAADPQLPQIYVRAGGAELFCIGLICDYRYPERSDQECLHHLATCLEKSETSFLNELDFMGGRHVIAYRRPDGGRYLLTDATGIKSAYYYYREKRLVSSHLKLAALNARHAEQRDAMPFRFGFPGHWTPCKNIYIVTPNTKLDLERFRCSRFWPTKPVSPRSVQEAADHARHLMRNALTYLARNYNPIVSVTAGIDSRVTLALTKGFEGIKYFTYYRSEDADTDALDRDFATQLHAAFGLNLEIIPATTAPDDYRLLLDQTTYYSHLPGISFAYFCRYGEDPKALHIRSNLSEIGRQFYALRSPFRPFLPTRSLDLARRWSRLKRDKNRYTMLTFFQVLDAFEEFDALTGLTSCPHVDRAALFYWEHRMGQWHSQVAAESDPAFETTSLYNCRAVLSALLSVTPEQQKHGEVLKAMIRDSWPDLARFPLNGIPFLEF